MLGISRLCGPDEMDDDNAPYLPRSVAYSTACAISSVGVPRFTRAGIPNLKYLKMTGVNLSDEGADVISRFIVQRRTTLKRLYLSHNNIMPAGAERIASALYELEGALQTLEYLDLSHNPLERAGCFFLSRAACHNCVLRMLDLRETHADRRQAIVTAREIEFAMTIIKCEILLSEDYPLRAEFVGPDGLKDADVARRLFTALVVAADDRAPTDIGFIGVEHTVMSLWPHDGAGGKIPRWHGVCQRNGGFIKTNPCETALAAAVERDVMIRCMVVSGALDDSSIMHNGRRAYVIRYYNFHNTVGFVDECVALGRTGFEIFNRLLAEWFKVG
jgi:hypothetical protein